MKLKSTMKEFKEFIMRGNILDMAIGIVVGNAFKAIVTSLVDNIIMPLVGAIGGKSIADLKWVIVEAVTDAATAEVIVAEVAVKYGAFLQSIIDFLIIAASMFVVIKTMATLSSLRKKKEEEAKAEEAPKKPDDIVLLEEIRDLLKDKE